VAAHKLVKRGERGRALQQRRLHAVREAERGGVRRHGLAGREREQHLAGAAPVGGKRAAQRCRALGMRCIPCPLVASLLLLSRAWRLDVQQGAWGMQQKRDAAAAHARVVHAAEKWFGPPCLNRTWGGRGCPRGAPRCSRSFAASAVTATLRISPERAARARAQPDL